MNEKSGMRPAALVERFFDSSMLRDLVEVALSRMIDEARLPTLARWIELATDNRMIRPLSSSQKRRFSSREAIFDAPKLWPHKQRVVSRKLIRLDQVHHGLRV